MWEATSAKCTRLNAECNKVFITLFNITTWLEGNWLMCLFLQFLKKISHLLHINQFTLQYNYTSYLRLHGHLHIHFSQSTQPCFYLIKVLFDNGHCFFNTNYPLVVILHLSLALGARFPHLLQTSQIFILLFLNQQQGNDLLGVLHL